MKKIRIWFMANFQDWPFWRVYYADGTRTYLLHRREAVGLRDVFNGEMILDYEYGKEMINNFR